MKLLVIPQGDEPRFEVEVDRPGRGHADYYIADKHWKSFQYDCRERPRNFTKEELKKETFHGFIISKKIKGKCDIVECYIKIIE